MGKKYVSILVLLFCVTLCPMSHAAEKKIRVALIDFADETPNKMAVTIDEKSGSNKIQMEKVMQVVKETTEESGLFELLPHDDVAAAMTTQFGKEAVARRFDRFSAIRLGKILGVDAILTGEIIQFDRNFIVKDITINGLDFSKRIDDVVIRARIINAYNGIELANATGYGNADENILETISTTISNSVSIGFLRAVNESIQRILTEFKSADIKVVSDDVALPSSQEKSDSKPVFFTVVKIEGNSIYIDAGYDKNVTIADLFTVLKEDGGNLIPAAIYSVTMVGTDFSRLDLVEPKKPQGKVLVGDKIQRKTRGAVMKLEGPKDEKKAPDKNKAKQPRRTRKVK